MRQGQSGLFLPSVKYLRKVGYMNKQVKSNEPTPIPAKYAGQVVVWDSVKRNRIVAVGKTYEEAEQAAEDSGLYGVLLQRVPPLGRTLIGWVA